MKTCSQILNTQVEPRNKDFDAILQTDWTRTTLQVATILVAMAPKILKLATWFVKKSP